MAFLGKAFGVAESNCHRVTVIGAGSMGAGIAAQFANAGVEVDLLDMPSEGEDRNKVANAGIARQLKVGGFMAAERAALVTAGNIEDNLDRVANSDWIIEAIIEDLGIKRGLYARLETLVKPTAVVASNTSTLPRAALIEGRSPAFADRFIIAHFFNPPRQMELLELICPPGSNTETFAAAAGHTVLGKTPVRCKDTPGFIANRIGCAWLAVGVLEALELGLTIEEADAIQTVFGVPRTGVFGLLDLIGLDLIPKIWGSLMEALPETDLINRVDLPAVPLVQDLLKAGNFGRKSGAGFYRRNPDRTISVVDIATGEYRDNSGFTAKDLPGGGRDLEALLADGTKYGEYARKVLAATIDYSRTHVEDICYEPRDLDLAMTLGYAWRNGPFAIAASLSPEATARLGDLPLPSIGGNPAKDRLSKAKESGTPLVGNDAASLWDLGDGIACLEVHTKMNAINAGVQDILEDTIGRLGGPIKGLVIGNHNRRAFSAGADLGTLSGLIETGEWDALDAFLARGHALYNALRHADVPSVAAVCGYTLGGGLELALHCTAVAAHSETRAYLPEFKVGILPAWGGSTRLVQRSQTPPNQGYSLDGLQKVFDTLTETGTPSSAREAAARGYFHDTDWLVMHGDDTFDSAVAILMQRMVGFVPFAPAILTLPGPSAVDDLMAGVRTKAEAGGFAKENLPVAEVIAQVLTGGADAKLEGTVGEAEMRVIEREGFMRLCRAPQAFERMRHMLKTGKPLYA